MAWFHIRSDTRAIRRAACLDKRLSHFLGSRRARSLSLQGDRRDDDDRLDEGRRRIVELGKMV